MQQKIKLYLKTGILLLGVCFLVFNCQKDDGFKEEQNAEIVKNQSFKISKINKERVLSNRIVKEKIETISRNIKQKENHLHNKDVVSSEHGFTINTNQVTYIENNDGTYHSYTFLIEREVETTILENLLLSLQSDGSYKMALLTYNITAQEKEDIANGLSVDVSNKVNSVEINEEGLITDIFSKDEFCTKIIETYCSAGLHPYGYFADGVPCDGYTENTIWESPGCAPGDPGSNNNNDTDNSNNNETDSNTSSGNEQTNNGGSGNPPPNDNENVTGITTSCEGVNCPEELDDCETIKQDLLDLVNNPTIKAHINGFRPGIFSEMNNNYKEDGARFAKTGNNQYVPRYPDERLNNGLDYSPDYEDNEVVSIHIHQQQYYDLDISPNPFFNAPVPSHKDIIELLENVHHISTTNASLSEEVTQIVMTEAGVFAMVIDTQNALNILSALEEQDEIKLKEFKVRFEKKVLGDWKKVNQNAGEVCDAQCLQRTINKFIKFMKKDKIAGNKFKAKVLQAVLNDNNEIIDWICN